MENYESVIEKIATNKYHAYMSGSNNSGLNCVDLICFIYKKSTQEVILDVNVVFQQLKNK